MIKTEIEVKNKPTRTRRTLSHKENSFKCSDGLLNNIWESNSVRLKTIINTPIDEKDIISGDINWTDIRAITRGAYYSQGDTHLLKDLIKKIIPYQNRKGIISNESGRACIDMSLLWVFSLLDYYAFTGNKIALRSCYNPMRKILKYFSNYVKDGLIVNTQGKVFTENAANRIRGTYTNINSLYYQALMVGSAIAGIIENNADVSLFIGLANEIKHSLNKHLYNSELGLFYDFKLADKFLDECGHHTNALIALFDIPDQYQKAVILKNIIVEPQFPKEYFVSYLLEALYENDKYSDALDIIRNKWQDKVSEPAADFDIKQNAWQLSVIRDLMAEYVGIKPSFTPNRFAVIPHLGNLNWVEGTVLTPKGNLKVRFEKTRNMEKVSMNIPNGVFIDFYAPGEKGSSITLNGKEQTSKSLSLSAGNYIIKIFPPRKPRPVRIENRFGKPAHVPQVEILENVDQIQKQDRFDRRRRRR